MYLKGSKRGEHGYAHVFTHVSDPKYPSISSEIRVSCIKCAEKNHLLPAAEKKKEDLEDGIAISVEDYKILKFARSNSICRAMYRMFAKDK